MKKTNLVPLLILIMAASCSRKGAEPLLTKWNHKISKENSFDRIIASSSLKPQQCFKDIFDVQTLRKEVAELEKKYAGGEKVTGTWRHLDLSTLPVPQANFLKEYGNKIGDLKNPEGVDYSGCDDVPCVFNRIYKKENHVAGYVHYLWYLKFGHMLSADNDVPEQKSKVPGMYNDKEFPLSAYLFTDTELFGLWSLSHALKEPYTNLNYLKEVQRTPRGETIEGLSRNVHGIAYSAGSIIISESGMSVRGERLDEGMLYHTLTHELGHHADFEAGRGTREFYRSHRQDYLDLIGMYLKEYEKDGKQIRQWTLHSRENLVTSYSGGNPQENFAEMIALFRIDGDMVKRKATQPHYDFFSEKFYDNKNFENESILNNWVEIYRPDIEREVLRAVVECSGEVSCQNRQMEELKKTLMNKVALNEPEGCGVFSEKENQEKWARTLQTHLKDALNHYLKEARSNKDYLAKIQSFYSEMEDRTLSNESYILCYGETNEVLCYEEILVGRIKKQIGNLKLTSTQERDLIDLYMSMHPYEVISSEVRASYRTFVNANLEKIRYGTDELWSSCRMGPQSDHQSPKGSIFQISEGYMVSSFYNCLNSSAPDILKQTVRSFNVDGAKLQNSNEEVILMDEVKPHLVKLLHSRFEAESMREFNEIRKFIEREDGSLRTRLLSDFSWTKNAVDPENLQKNCLAETIKGISFEPLFHIKSKVFSEMVRNKICVGIDSSSEYKRWESESQEMFKEIVAKDSEEMLLAAGEERALSCLEKFPITNSVSKIKHRDDRESCLTSNWREIENKVMNELKDHPYVLKFQFNTNDFRTDLSVSARRVQLKLIKERFN